jgi:hypothetical protein
MQETIIPIKHSRTSTIVFILSVIVSGYWWLGQAINVYRFAIVGAIFEILWLPSLVMLIFIPLISLLLLVYETVHFRSRYIYSILISVAIILAMILSK